MEKAKKPKQDNRARNWTFIAYPESCEKIDLISTLDDLHIEYAISPLHDSDINADGTKKNRIIMWDCSLTAKRAIRRF